MSEKIIFNFFDDSIEDNIQKLVDYFRLEKDKVIEYISSFDNPADITVENFIVEFGINLTNFDCANVDIVCRHMTVLTEEGLEDVKTKGLLDLVGVLTEDTVLKRFLYENQVVFDVQGNSYMPNYYINNRNLERFLSFWFENEQHICADEECGVSCTYCDSFYRNNIIGKE